MSAPTPPDPAERLKALEEKLAARRVAPKVQAHGESHYSQAQLAWRMVIELVAGLGIGFGIGYGLDSLFGTMPIFLVIFIFFGLAAGVNTMLRSAKEMQAKQEAAGAAQDEDEARGR
ncbi:AtpZ/AtpI family protein [Salipiger sp. IMCC34102]|uniref:AtpZ/AtpI family protein n=1 Tax=Salipiger sp. IMCC34102 TaxID=2510647 RepID=UPI00101C7E21|nr:AtpZ/AtpI family protein [Salipiger sp. IMCC34102]RYH03982.1 AtpZ/AtpI family protein [Salipiger sp. IMCC34102]